MQARFAIVAVLAIGNVALAGGACSAAGNQDALDFGASGGGGAGSDAGTGTAPSTSSSSQGIGGSIVGVGGSASTGGCAHHCSSDLHSVLDCNDVVVSTCPADQGCSATGCVPACDSAKQDKSTIGCEYYAVGP